MDREIEITKENCGDYIELYKAKNKIDRQSNHLIRVLRWTEYLGLFVSLFISKFVFIPESDALIALVSFVIMGYTTTMEFVVNPKIKRKYQTEKNQKLVEQFPNIDTKLKTEELESVLMSIKAFKFVQIWEPSIFHKKGHTKNQTIIDEAQALKYVNECEQRSREIEEKENERLERINQYQETRKELLANIPSINCPIFVPEEQLERVKKQVKTLVKNKK